MFQSCVSMLKSQSRCLIVQFLHGKGVLDIRSTLEYLMTLFPRKLFNDALPRIVLKHQLYSLHRDKTMVDKELVWLFCATKFRFTCLNMTEGFFKILTE